MVYENIEYEILSKLLEDGRASYRNIAANIGVSAATVANHIEEMEKEGLVKGVRPVLDHSKLGYTITSILMIKAKGQGIPELAEELGNIDDLTDVYEITGNFDLMIIGKFKNTKHMNKMIKQVLNHDLVEESNTNIVLSTIKEDDDIKLSKN